MSVPDDFERREIERLANAVLWPGFLGSEVPDWLADALRDGLAGVVYFAQNLGGDTSALSAEHCAASTPRSTRVW